jgi:predicted ABC-type ATPase
MTQNTTLEEFLRNLDTSIPTVFIMRGLPGSGKSTAANKISQIYNHWSGTASADNYWMHGNEYRFDPTQVPKNHHYCLRTFIEMVGVGPGTKSNPQFQAVIVDNTNLALHEFSHYVKIAQACGYNVVVLTLICSVEDSLKRNVHSVPEKTIRAMQRRLADSIESVGTSCNSEKIPNYVIDTTSKY